MNNGLQFFIFASHRFLVRMYENFTSFIIAFLHLEFSPIISCEVGTFKTFSVSDEIFDTADVAKLSIRTSLLGLDFFHLL